MSVGLINNSVFTTAEMVVCREKYKAFEEECKLKTDIKSHTIPKGKKVSTTRKLLNSKIQFAQMRVSRIKLLSKMLNENKEEQISHLVAQMAKSEMTNEQNFVM